MKHNKGQFGLTAVIITGVLALLGSLGGGWISGSASAQKEISAVNLKVELVKNTEELHYKELKEDNVEVKRLLQILIDKK